MTLQPIEVQLGCESPDPFEQIAVHGSFRAYNGWSAINVEDVRQRWVAWMLQKPWGRIYMSTDFIPSQETRGLRYAWAVDTQLTPDAAVERVTALLAEQGFGVLTRMDVHEVLARKLGIQRSPYVILGACNPQLAHQAITAESAIGILLPCNVVIEGRGDGTRVWVTRPEGVFALVERDDLGPVVEAVSVRLRAVLDGLRAVA